MRKTAQMIALEEQHGRPIRSLLIDAYAKHGTLGRAAESLGVKTQTLYSWMVRLQIHIHKTAVITPFSDTAEREAIAV